MLPLSGSLDDMGSGMPLTVRTVFLVGPGKKVRMKLSYPPSCGRNFVEILRVIDSIQHTTYDKLATPVNWPHSKETGNKCCILPSVSNDEANEKYSGFETVKLPSGKSYLRLANKVPVKK